MHQATSSGVSPPEREATSKAICEWILTLQREESLPPPHFDSPYANAIVETILSYQAKLREQRRRERALDATLSRLLEGKSVEELLDFIFESFQEFIPYDRIGLTLIDEQDASYAEAVYMRLREGPPLLGKGYRVKLESTSLGEVLKSGQPRIISDLEEYLKSHPKSYSTYLLCKEGMRASLTVPLQALGRSVGFLFFSSRQAGLYTMEHAELLLRIARKVGLSIEKARILECLSLRNQQVTMLTNMVCHDMRGLLGVVSGHVELLALGELGSLTDLQSKSLEAVRQACRQGTHLMQNVLCQALIEGGYLHPQKCEFDLGHLLTEQVELQRPASDKKGVTVHCSWSADLPKALGDPSFVTRVFDNILNNALKYSPTDSSIFVTIDRRGNKLFVEVQDEGAGLTAEQQRDVFKCFPSFAQRKRTAGLTSIGLGLAVAKQLAEANGGEIGVRSQAGQGATFWFSLPVANDSPAGL